MIKKYNQFVNDRINEDVELDIDTNQDDAEIEQEIEQEIVDSENSDVEELEQEIVSSEEEQEEEGGDVYASKLQEIADKLGTEVTNGKIEYNGKKIMFPSETEMYHVGGKKFKTADEVVSFLDEGEEKPNMEEMERVPHEDINDDGENTLDELQRESKSYKNTRKFK